MWKILTWEDSPRLWQLVAERSPRDIVVPTSRRRLPVTLFSPPSRVIFVSIRPSFHHSSTYHFHLHRRFRPLAILARADLSIVARSPLACRSMLEETTGRVAIAQPSPRTLASYDSEIFIIVSLENARSPDSTALCKWENVSFELSTTMSRLRFFL